MSARLAVLLCLGGFGVVAAAASLAAQPASGQAGHAGSAGTTRSARTIVYHPRDILPLHARVHYTTLIVLPDGEDVVEVTCGDKELWIVNVRGGLVSVKPVKPGSETNLNLVTTTGQVYAFVLTEVSADKAQDADLTVYLEPDLAVSDPPGLTAEPRAAKPKFVSAEQLEDFRAQAELAREQARHANDEARRATEQARTDLDSELTAFRTSYPLTLQFDYRFKADTKPFFLEAMFHDDHRTFIRSAARELPAVYEFKDGQSNLVNFDVQQGIYVIPKVLEDGYLMIGNARIGFRRVDRGAR
jgi:type IV secretion system protein VirB9